LPIVAGLHAAIPSVRREHHVARAIIKRRPFWSAAARRHGARRPADAAADISAEVKAGPVGERGDGSRLGFVNGLGGFLRSSAAPAVPAASNANTPALAATTTFMTPSPADFLFSVPNDRKYAANGCCQIETNTQKSVRVYTALVAAAILAFWRKSNK
jgi:hypothetical protein